jgi:drug/metabolite transporter superfamily protein YnfA
VLILKAFALFVATAVAEILGCYLPYLWLKRNGSPWMLIPSLLSLALFAWLLTLHPTAAGRVYAAYGGVYICSDSFSAARRSAEVRSAFARTAHAFNAASTLRLPVRALSALISCSVS